MDFERAICRAYFYDYPLSTAVDAIKEDWDIKRYLKPLELLLNVRMPSFTLGEVRQLKTKEQEYWQTKHPSSTLIVPMLRLADVCGSMLNLDAGDGYPKVRFKYLLKWRELSLLLGEDIPICISLANNDKGGAPRGEFLWPDTIGNENDQINAFLKKHPKSDIHVHMDASSNAFDVGWIRRMNWRPWTSPMGYTKKDLEDKSMIENDGTMELELNFWFQNHYGNYYADWVNLSAVIRYWMYRIVVDNVGPTSSEQKEILDAVNDKMRSLHLQNKIFFRIKSLRSLAPRALNVTHVHWDYAIDNHIVDGACSQSPYMLLFGERKLIYSFMWMLLQRGDNVAKKFAPFFYLYLLIKTHCRKELIMTNGQIGLANYQEYQNRLPVLSKDISELRHRYALQTSSGLSKKDYVEARVPFPDDDISPVMISNDVLTAPLMGRSIVTQPNGHRAGIVLTWSKPTYNKKYGLANDRLLKKRQLDLFLTNLYGKNHSKKYLPYVGIDIAGSDTKSRPYDFAHVVRYGRKKGFDNFTYHIAEDFYDLADGLRAIDELLFHVEWNRNNRLSHALALFTNARRYYLGRHCKIVMPVQMMLDNYVWLLLWADRLKLTLPADVKEYMEEQAKTLYNKFRTLKNSAKLPVWNMKDYQQSMLLRGEDAVGPRVGIGSPDKYEDTRYSTNAKVARAWNNPNAIKIHRFYKEDESAYTIGQRIETGSMPKCDEFMVLIEKIQHALIKRIRSRKIRVESCPTSNYHIGNFDKYDELPIVEMLSPNNAKREISASINTDARAIFDTSLDNEYSLMAIALHKKGYRDEEIDKFLRRSVRSSNKARFSDC